MKKNGYLVCFSLVVLAFSMSVIGCATMEPSVIHDELLVYDMSADKAYMLTLDAVDATPEWSLSGTDHLKGEIYAQRLSLRRDVDATIIVKSLGRKQSSVELAPESQTVKGVEELLKTIDFVLNNNLQ